MAADSIEDGLLNLLKDINADDYEQITLFYGNGLTEEEVKPYIDAVQDAYPDLDVECHYGGQPHYYFSIAVE